MCIDCEQQTPAGQDAIVHWQVVGITDIVGTPYWITHLYDLQLLPWAELVSDTHPSYMLSYPLTACRYVQQVAAINALEPLMRSLTDSQLAEQTLRFRDILMKNTDRIPDALNEILPEAFATVREASRRVLGMRHFDSQLVGKLP